MIYKVFPQVVKPVKRHTIDCTTMYHHSISLFSCIFHIVLISCSIDGFLSLDESELDPTSLFLDQNEEPNPSKNFFAEKPKSIIPTKDLLVDDNETFSDFLLPNTDDIFNPFSLDSSSSSDDLLFSPSSSNLLALTSASDSSNCQLSPRNPRARRRRSESCTVNGASGDAEGIATPSSIFVDDFLAQEIKKRWCPTVDLVPFAFIPVCQLELRGKTRNPFGFYVYPETGAYGDLRVYHVLSGTLSM